MSLSRFFFEFCQTLISFIAASAVIGQLNIFVLMALFMLLVVKYVVRKRIDKAIIKIREDLVRINRKNGYLVSILSNKDQVRDLKMNRGIFFAQNSECNIMIRERSRRCSQGKESCSVFRLL